MSRFLESISVRNRSFEHLPWHSKRVEQTQAASLGESPLADLSQFLSIPAELGHQQYKCRIVYDRSIREVSFTPYVAKSIRSLKVVEGNGIEYSKKWEDRNALAELYAQRGEQDDILIIKDGYLTDTYYANVAFWDGIKWLTPATPLLEGTCRARLLAEGILEEAPIRLEDLPSFQNIRLMNALLGWSKSNEFSIHQIIRST